MAPEVIMNSGHHKPADWWTLGIFLYEMISGKLTSRNIKFNSHFN